jgi:hypothetical protein
MLGYYNKAISFCINNEEHNSSNYLKKFIIENDKHKDDMILASTYFDMIFRKILEIFQKDGNLINIDNYEIHFENDVGVIKHRK